MATGTINNFPIPIIFELANREDFGMCPQLCAYIHDNVEEADYNAAASEHAIRLAIDGVSDVIGYENTGSGEGIFNNLAGVHAYFNGLSGQGNLTVGLASDTITFVGEREIIDGGGGGAIDPIPHIYSVQGGKHQYSTTLSASTLTPGSGYILAEAKTDDVIGKIFLNCVNGFSTADTLISVGNDTNSEAYIQQFNAPIVSGLIDSEKALYGPSLTGEYNWINETAGEEIKLFVGGSASTSGSVGVSIFYDQVVWPPDYGYFLGNSENNITRFNMEFDYLAPSDRGVVITPDISNNTACSKNSYIYTAGGSDDSYVSIDTISRYETKNDTVDILPRSNLSTVKRDVMSNKSSTKLFLFGGANGVNTIAETRYNTIETLTFSNDTGAVAAGAGGLPAVNRSGGTVSNSTHIWIGGGMAVGSYDSIASIAKVDVAATTAAASTAVLGTSRFQLMHCNFDTPVHGYFGPGGNQSGATELHSSLITKMVKSTETVSELDFSSLINYWAGSGCQSKSAGYIAAQQTITTGTVSDINLMLKTDFQTDVISISSVSLVPNLLGQSASI